MELRWILILFFILSIPLQGQEIQDLSPSLKTTLSGNGPWLVLGLVSDSEKQSSITDDGVSLRKELELILQSMGEEVIPLSLAERMKLERLWSLPFNGRISKELKQEMVNLETSLITGSYAAHRQEELQMIVYDLKEKKTLVFHEKRKKKQVIPSTTSAPSHPIRKTVETETPPQEKVSPASKSVEPKNVDEPSGQEIHNDTLGDLLSYNVHLKTSRAPPKESRRQRKTDETHKLEELKLELLGNDILKQYASERQHLSEEKKLSFCRELIKSSQQTILTSAKIELLRRAFILNSAMKVPQKDIEEYSLRHLLEHREFFQDRLD